MQKGTDGFTVVLTQTAREGRVETVLDGIKSPLIGEASSRISSAKT